MQRKLDAKPIAWLLKMKWKCDVCHRENVCDVPSEMHFFRVILMAKRDHERLSPSCDWANIHGWMQYHAAKS